MGQTFQVLTEFKFDASSAVAQSKVLQSAVDGVSTAADGALDSLKRLGMGAVAGLGLGGVIGTLKQAVQVSDLFQNSVLDFSTTIATNMQFLQGSVGNFNDRLAATQTIMTDISKTADRLNLSQGDLFSIVKATVPQLAPHGAAGDNFKSAIGLSSQALVAGSNLGLKSSDISTQLAQLLAGTAQEGGLAGRLMGTNAFKGAGGTDGFNSKDFQERMKMLSAGLGELGQDMGMLAARANLFSFQLTKLKTAFLGDENGMGSILKPLGDSIRPFFVNILKGVNGYVSNEGAQIVRNFASLTKSMITTPEKMIVDLLQLKNLKGDVKEAGHITGTIGVVTGIGGALKFLTGNALFLNPIIGVTTGLFMLLGSALRRSHDPISAFIAKTAEYATIGTVAIGILAKLGILFDVLKFVLVDVLAPLALFTTLLQAMSRAKAKAQVEDVEVMFRLAPKLSELAIRAKMAFHNLMSPIEDIIEGWSNIFKPLFAWGSILEYLMPLLDSCVSIFEGFGDAVMGVMGIISGVTMMIIGIISDITSLKNPLTNMGDNFKNGFDDYVRGHMQKMDQGGNVSNTITNIGRVEIKNDFKENQEPDRIAFTMKEQLLKAAQNPKQARGQALQMGFGR